MEQEVALLLVEKATERDPLSPKRNPGEAPGFGDTDRAEVPDRRTFSSEEVPGSPFPRSTDGIQGLVTMCQPLGHAILEHEGRGPLLLQTRSRLTH